jgi:glutamyl-tRNA synthetase
MKEIILKFVLKNAFDYGGSINPKAVLGQVLRSNPELKKDVPEVMKTINVAVAEVKGKNKEEIRAELESIAPELLQIKDKEEDKIEGPLKPLSGAQKGKFVVRIAPSPSGALHIGHAYGSSLNAVYAQMYEGKFILRIEDTNPENIYPKAYDLIKEDAMWLTDGKIDEVIIQSSRLGHYYDAAEKLVDLGKAYVCTCDADKWRELKNDGKACPCRNLGVKEQHIRYAKMFSEYKEGQAVLRCMTDIQHKNPAMRDFPIMRINEHVHPKTKTEHKVWPLMVLSVAIDDHELGMTHVLNGKDHADNAKKESIIMKYLGWKPPVYKHWGRINFEGFTLSTSKTRIAIEQKEYTGWDDIRLPFLPALRKRGYQAKALQKFACGIGLSLNDKTVSQEEFWKQVNAFNKEIVEPMANRYFFISNPVEIALIGGNEKEVEFDVHADFPKRGKRKVLFKGTVMLAKDDVEKFEEGKIHRLIDCCNFIVENCAYKVVSEDYEEYKNAQNKGKIVHWLPKEHKFEQTSILMEDGTKLDGVGEESLSKLKEGDIIQFERMFFARLNSKEKMEFYHLHK